MKNKLSISFKNDRETYEPTDTVEGEVVLEVLEAETLKCLQVKLRGKCEVTMFIGDYDKETELYFVTSEILLGIPPWEEGPLITLEPGVYNYPFSFLLPERIPNSFKWEGDESGEVSYMVEATVHRPAFFNLHKERHFTVINPLNIGLIPNFHDSLTVEGSQSLNCMRLKFGTVFATFSVSHQAYMHGEHIQYSVKIVNESSQRIKSLRVTLNQFVVLNMFGYVNVKTKKMQSLDRGRPVKAGQTDVWVHEMLVEPGLTPSFMAGCSLIDIQYELSLTVKPGSCSRQLSLSLPVIIGSVSESQENTRKLRLLRKLPTLAVVSQTEAAVSNSFGENSMGRNSFTSPDTSV